MMSVVTLLMIAILTPAIGATAKRSTCESEARREKSAATVFLRLTTAAFSLNEISPSDLDWAQQSETPVNPIRRGKSVDSLSLNQALNALLPQINSKDWLEIRSGLKKIKEIKQQEDTAVDSAQAATAPIYVWRKLPFQPKAFPITQLVAKNGEVLVVSQDKSRTYLSEIHKAEVQSHDFSSPNWEYSDLYETKNGRVIFATLNETHIKVIDARTGNSLLDYPLSEHPGFTDGQVGRYHVRLFEKGRDLKVVVAPRHDQINSGNSSPLLIAVVDVKSGQLSINEFPAVTKMRTERLENGRVYCFGAGFEAASSTNRLFIFDIVSRRYVMEYRLPFDVRNQPDLNLDYQDLYLNDSGIPELIYFQHSTTGIYRYDAKKGALQRILTGSPGRNRMTLFRDTDQKIKMVYTDSNGRSEFTITVAPVDGTPPKKYQFQLSRQFAGFYPSSIFFTPRGPVLVQPESRVGFGIQIAVIELATGTHYSLPTNVGDLNSLFYSPLDQKILTFASEVGRPFSERHLFQVWGTTRD